MRVHDSQAYRKMGVTRERISRILEQNINIIINIILDDIAGNDSEVLQ